NCIFFFFQAEDGIRDFHVTGVQTCALPISPPTTAPDVRGGGAFTVASDVFALGLLLYRLLTGLRAFPPVSFHHHSPPVSGFSHRSEERRVGKECRVRCLPRADKHSE